MEEEKKIIINNCNFMGVKPLMMELPYPPLQVSERNRQYADILSLDYCGGVSEMTAITQYISHESRLSVDKCPLAKILLGIAMAEMIHLQKLAEMIILLGGNVDFVVRQQNGQPKMWNPSQIKLSDNTEKMIWEDIEGEKAAIRQYEMHIKMIKDENINAVLYRIIKDEEYHILLLQAALKMN